MEESLKKKLTNKALKSEYSKCSKTLALVFVFLDTQGKNQSIWDEWASHNITPTDFEMNLLE